jgi:hypothetical protein
MTEFSFTDRLICASAQAWASDGEVLATGIGLIPRLAASLCMRCINTDLMMTDSEAWTVQEPVPVGPRGSYRVRRENHMGFARVFDSVWSGRRHAQDVTDAFASVAAIDTAAGAIPLPALAESLLLADDDEAEPLAYTYDSRPILSVQLGAESALGHTSGACNGNCGTYLPADEPHTIKLVLPRSQTFLEHGDAVGCRRTIHTFLVSPLLELFDA